MSRPAPDLTQWSETWVEQAHGNEMHIVPVTDLIAHELDSECICGPYWENLREGDFLVAHHPLDSRIT